MEPEIGCWLSALATFREHEAVSYKLTSAINAGISLMEPEP